MKNRSFLWVVLTIAGFCFIGCSSTPRITNVPYTFGAAANGTAAIDFYSRVEFVTLEGEQLPTAEEGSRWYPLQFPAGREFSIRVSAYGHRETYGEIDRRMVTFKCPPLEAGKKYKLWFEPAAKNYYSGAGRLILTYSDVKELKYSFGRPRYNQIYVQEIPPLE